MIKVDGNYSISENGYGFVLSKYNGKKTTKTIGYFYELSEAFKEYVRQKTMEAVGDDGTETEFRTVRDEIKRAMRQIENITYNKRVLEAVRTQNKQLKKEN